VAFLEGQIVLRKELPVWIGTIAGGIVVIDYFFNIPGLNTISREIVSWRIILAAFALALGIGNLTRIHMRRLRERRAYWPYSLILLVTIYGYLALGLIASANHPTYKFFWNNLYQPLSATWYSTTVFYMCSATWRAFRARTPQAAVLLLSGIIVMLGSVGIGYAISPQIPKLSAWLIAIPNTASMRGITIGGALGMIALSMRVILGLERGHLGGVGE
jgi:uncharacterized membrane protein YhaH (DUF805 family)